MHTDDRRAVDLEELGLTNYEARVYLALIRRDVFTAAEVAREAQVPRQRVYDVLEGLTRRQLAVLHPGRVAGYSAVAPEVAVDRLMEQQRRSISRLERLSSELARELLPTWSNGRTHTDPLDYVEVLRDPADISERFARIMTAAEREILSFSKPPYVTPTENEAGLAAAARLHAEQCVMRSVYTEDLLDDPELLAVAHRFVEAGEEIRIAESLPLKLIVTDRTTVMCDMPDPVARAEATTSLLIRHPSLAEALRLAFQSVWDQSATLDEALAARAARAAAAPAAEAPADATPPADAAVGTAALPAAAEAAPKAAPAAAVPPQPGPVEDDAAAPAPN